MTFLHLAPAQLLAAFLGILGVLYVLQRLRVRHREVPVITTLFWQQAVEESRARVLTKRFRHPLAFLLIATIAGLLLLALAGPQTPPGDRRSHIVFLDASANMAAAGRFERALRTLDETVAALPRDHTRVVQVGADERTLLLPGEPAELLSHRLANVTPEACPPAIEDALRGAIANFARRGEFSAEGDPSGGAAAGDDAGHLAVWVVGDAPIAEDTLSLVPDSVEVHRVASSDGSPLASPRESPDPATHGITALGVGEAASGAWSTVDVLVETRGDARGLTVTLDGAALDLGEPGGVATTASPERGPSVTTAHLLRDVPARGGLLIASLDPDAGSPLDDVARIRLPDRPRIRVRVAQELAPLFLPALLADPAVALVADGEGADVSIRAGGQSAGTSEAATDASGESEAAALQLVADDDGRDAFVIHHRSGDDPEDVLREGLEALGLLEIDATGLATEVGREIRVGTDETGQRGLSVWASLFGDGYDFRQSRAFPLFLARAVRYLGGGEAITARVSAGEPVAGVGRTVDETGRPLDPAGADFQPPRAGKYTTEDGTAIYASLLAPVGAVSATPLAGEPAPASSAGVTLIQLLGLIAFSLLLLEWLLFRTERIP